MTPEGTACRQLVDDALTHYQLPATESAIRLLCMIAAHESGDFHYVRQLRGPAMSLFQIEPATFENLCNFAINRRLTIASSLPCSEWQLVFDQRFAAAMGRVFFLRFKEPLPGADNLDDLARYAKQYWNTHLGKATPDDYLNAYLEHFTED